MLSSSAISMMLCALSFQLIFLITIDSEIGPRTLLTKGSIVLSFLLAIANIIPLRVKKLRTVKRL